MASTSRTPLNEQAKLVLIGGRRRRQLPKAVSLTRRIMTTLAALGLLAVVLKFLPPESKHSAVQAGPRVTQVQPAELHLRDVQVSQQPFDGTLYLDGLVTNAGESRVTAAVAELEFHDRQGQVIGKVQTPLAGISQGGSGVVRNEFTHNPIRPNVFRFFRIAVQHVPADWNRELPGIKLVAVKAE